MLFKQSETTAARRTVYFVLTQSDRVTPYTSAISGADVQLGKAGGALGNAVGTATNLTANGLYKLVCDATDVDTLGEIVLVVAKTGVATMQLSLGQVVPWDPYDSVRLGQTALPNAAAEAAGGLYTRGTGAGQINQDANGRIDANAKAWIGGTIPAVNVTGVPKVDIVDWLGSAPDALSSGKVASDLKLWLATAPAAVTTNGYVKTTLLRWLTDDAAGTPLSLNTGSVQVDVERVSNDATAPANIASTFNGVGYVAATAPAQMQQVANIAVTSAALNQTAASRTITTGSGAGGVANTNTIDAVFDSVSDTAGTTDFYYEFDVSAISNAVGVGVTWDGYLVGAVNTLKVYAYNWGGTSWDQVGTIVGIAGTLVVSDEWDLTAAHTSAGLVRIRFNNTGLVASTLKTDRILLGYVVTPPLPATISAAVWDQSRASHRNAGTFGETLPDAAASASGGLLTFGSGAGQINVDGAGNAKADLQKWLTAAPASLTTNGYVQSMLLRWLTDNAAGTPNALNANRVDAYLGASTIDLTTITSNLQAALGIVRTGAAQGGTSVSITLDSSASANNDYYVGQDASVIGGAGSGQTRQVVAYNGTTKVATVHRPWVTTNPDNTSTFAIKASHFDTTVIRVGLAQAGGSASITLDSAASNVNGTYVGQEACLLAGTGKDQVELITAYDGTTKVATVATNWVTVPDATTVVAINASSGQLETGTVPGVNVVKWLGSTPDVLSSGKVPADLKLWLAVAPASLSASGYVQSMLLRWLTDNGAGTPDALSSNKVPADLKLWLTAVPDVLSSGKVPSDLKLWLASAPASLSTNGYVQSMLLRWLTDNAGGTPDALSSGKVASDLKLWLATAPASVTTNGFVKSAVLRWLTDDAAGTPDALSTNKVPVDVKLWLTAAPAALSTNGYVQAMLLRWLTDNGAGTPDALISGDVDVNVGGYQSGQAPLQPTVAGRTLNVGADNAGDANLQKWVNVVPDALSSGKVPADLKLWLTAAPASLTTNGYVKSALLRWLTDDAAGTPNALTATHNVPIDTAIGDDLNLLLGLLHNNAVVDNTSYNVNQLLTAARLRVFASAAAAAAATTGAANGADGEINRWTILAVDNGSGQPSQFNRYQFTRQL